MCEKSESIEAVASLLLLAARVDATSSGLMPVVPMVDLIGIFTPPCEEDAISTAPVVEAVAEVLARQEEDSRGKSSPNPGGGTASNYEKEEGEKATRRRGRRRKNTSLGSGSK